jgi:hypothetical protein
MFKSIDSLACTEGARSFHKAIACGKNEYKWAPVWATGLCSRISRKFCCVLSIGAPENIIGPLIIWYSEASLTDYIWIVHYPQWLSKIVSVLGIKILSLYSILGQFTRRSHCTTFAVHYFCYLCTYSTPFLNIKAHKLTFKPSPSEVHPW